MNPFATGTSAGHAPLEGATESTRGGRAENRGSNRKDENEEGRQRVERCTRVSDEEKGKKGREREQGETEKWSGRTARRRPWLGDLYRIISPSECLHF